MVLTSEFCRLAIVLVLVMPIAAVTEFRLQGSVYCNLKGKPFRFRVVIEEDDAAKKNDIIATFGVKTSTGYKHRVEMVGSQTGDCLFGLFCDDYYEVITYIYHSCSSDKATIIRKIRDPWPGTYSVNKTSFNRDIDINLTDAGEIVEAYFE